MPDTATHSAPEKVKKKKKITSPYISFGKDKLSSSYWRQRQTLYCTAIFSSQLIQVYRREKTQTLPGYSRGTGLGKNRTGREDVLLKASLQTGMCLVTRF